MRGARGVLTVAYIAIPLFAIGAVVGGVIGYHKWMHTWVKPWLQTHKEDVEQGLKELENYANWGRRKGKKDE